MEKQKNIPALRFTEFGGEWGDTTLKEVVDFRNGKAHEQHISENGKYVVINSKFISRNGEVRKFSDEAICPLELGEITMVMSDVPRGKALAKCFLVNERNKYTLNQRICALRAKLSDPKFLIIILNRNKYYLAFDSGVGQTNLTRSEVLNCPITLPLELLEQQKIANFLTAIDEKLQTLKKKKALLEQYKKGVMQKIFSQELRFKDENGNNFADWEVKKLGDVFYCEKGKGLSKEKLSKTGINECILYGELYTKYSEVVFSIASKTNEYEGLRSQIGDLLIPCSTTTTGIDLANITALNKEGILLGGDITVLRSLRKINNIFYAYYLSNHKKEEIASYAQGSTIVHLYFSHIKDMAIDFPSLPEQTKIANFLTTIDEKINQQQNQIEKVSYYKKGLLQQMFC